MKTKLAVLLLILLGIGGRAFAQGQSYTAGPFPQSGFLYVCPVPSGGTPCPTPSTISSSATLTPTIGNPIQMTAGNTVTFFAASGQYTIQFPASGYSLVVSLGGGGGITSVASLPATCSVGVTAPVQLTVAPYAVYVCIATNTWGPSSAPAGSSTQLQFNNGGAFGGIAGSSTLNGGVKFIAQTAGTVPLASDSTGGLSGNYFEVRGTGSVFFSVDNTGNPDTPGHYSSGNTATVVGSRVSYGFDTTTTTPNFGTNNGVGVTSFTGAWNCNNVTPVTVSANVATDQLLMACTIGAGTLNRVGRSLRIMTGSIYSTPAASTTAMTIKVKICSVSGCGSGNVLTAATITSGALGTIQVTNNAIQLPLYLTVQTAGATLAVEAHGCMYIDLAASISAADTVFCDNNIATQTGTPSAIDSTAQNFLQITGAFTVASGSNSWSNRQLVAETIN